MSITENDLENAARGFLRGEVSLADLQGCFEEATPAARDMVLKIRLYRVFSRHSSEPLDSRPGKLLDLAAEYLSTEDLILHLTTAYANAPIAQRFLESLLSHSPERFDDRQLQTIEQMCTDLGGPIQAIREKREIDEQ